MAKSKTKDLRAQTDADLKREAGELREQLFKLRWQAKTGNIENPNKIREVRKSIARHLTILGERAAPGTQDGGKP
jgi:large subunit ribosomal protein L29